MENNMIESYFSVGNVLINFGIASTIIGIVLIIFMRKEIVFKNIRLFSIGNIFLGIAFFIIGITSIIKSLNLDIYKFAIVIYFSNLFFSLQIMYFIFTLLKKYKNEKIRFISFIMLLIFIAICIMPILYIYVL